MPDRPPGERERVVDRGAQSERTRLSWGRTSLSFAAIGALLLHAGSTGSRLQEVPGLVVLCFAVATYLLGVDRYRSTPSAVRHADRVVSATPIRTLAALTAVTAALSLVLIVT